MENTLNNVQINDTQIFPREVPLKAAQGFIITAAMSLYSGYSCNTALLSGATAATATVIEALTRPILRNIFREHPPIAIGIQFFIPRMAAISLANSIQPWNGINYNTSFDVFKLVAWVALNKNFYMNNVGMVQIL